MSNSSSIRELSDEANKIKGEKQMARPVTLFTGQWADLPLEDLANKASEWGYD